MRNDQPRYGFPISRALGMLVLTIGLAGCEGDTSTAYLFGASKSCFPGYNNRNCDQLKIYDKVTFRPIKERQEVSLLREAVNLDSSNAIFSTLKDCKVIDIDNYQCDRLKMLEGKFVDTRIFDDLMISRSYASYLWSRYAEKSIRRSTLEFASDNDSWIEPGLLAISVLIFFGAFSPANQR